MNVSELAPSWLVEGARVVVMRERDFDVESMPGVVKDFMPHSDWWHVTAVTDTGRRFLFTVTEAGVVGCTNGMDSYGFPIRLEAA